MLPPNVLLSGKPRVRRLRGLTTQQLGDPLPAEVLRELESGLAREAECARSSDLGVCARLHQEPCHRVAAVDGGEHERREPVLGGVIEIGSSFYKNTYGLKMTVPGGDHERRLAVSIERVDVFALIEEVAQSVGITALRGFLPIPLQAMSRGRFPVSR